MKSNLFWLNFAVLIVLLPLFGYSQDYQSDYRYYGKPKVKKRPQYVPRYPLEMGFHLGSTQFLGDLGGGEGLAQPFFFDTDWMGSRPSLGAFARYSMGGNFSFRADMRYLYLAGNDQWAGSNFSAQRHGETAGWFRYYRNLHFRSHVFEFALSTEIAPYNFKISGNLYSTVKHNMLSPYFVIGTGLMVFNPQAHYDGQWVNLQPLRTEGQAEAYSLAQFIIPVGFGVRWEHNHDWILSLEVNHRFTFTDYLDDVSGDYVDPQTFHDQMPVEQAHLAASLARRSQEQDPQERYGYITAPGEMRGNSTNNDSYYTIELRLAIYLKRSRPWALVKDY